MNGGRESGRSGEELEDVGDGVYWSDVEFDGFVVANADVDGNVVSGELFVGGVGSVGTRSGTHSE